MPLTPNAPNLLPDDNSLLEQSPSYSPPDMGELTDPKQVIANDQARNSDAATFLQGASDVGNLSLRNRAFGLQQQQTEQQMQLDALLNPLKVASAQAQNTLLQQQVDHSTDAFTRLPDYAAQLNALDPASDDFGVQASNILAKASDNPALFQQLQPMVENAKAKRQAYLQTSLGAPGAQIAADAKTGNPAAISAWQDWQAGIKNGTDPTTMLGKFAAYQNQKATAVRAGFQAQMAQLGPYAPPMPPKLSMGIYDPDEIADFQKEVETAAQQKEEGAKFQDLYGVKNQGALDVQTLKNQGRMDVTTFRYGSSPQAQTEQGKQMVNAANAINLQLKNPNILPADKIRLQGQLEGINDEMERQLGLPAAAATTPGAGATDQGAADTLDQAIKTVQGQIDLGNEDLPKGVSLPTGVTDPVNHGFLGTGIGGNVPDGSTPNQFRLQHFQQLRNNLPGTPAPAGAPQSSVDVEGGADPSAIFQPVTGATDSLAPETDAALSATAPTATAFAGGPAITPSPAAVATTKASMAKRIGPQTVTLTPNATTIVPKGLAMRPPPPDAVAYLRAHPELAPAFDQKYGQGSADLVLKQQ